MKKRLVVALIVFAIAAASAGLFTARVHAQGPGATVLKSWGSLRGGSPITMETGFLLFFEDASGTIRVYNTSEQALKAEIHRK
jgi:hypothetical protein